MQKSEQEGWVGRNPLTNHDIRPLSGWTRTGFVPVGEIGPGCPVACIYCNQMGMDRGETGEKLAPYISFTVDGGISLNTRLVVGTRVERTISNNDLLRELRENPFYHRESPIFLENFNDPGFNWENTTSFIGEIMQILDHQGPIVFITKMAIREEYVEKLRILQAQGAKIIGIVTYSGMPKGIEKSGDHIRIATLKKLHDAGIPTILSMRPLVQGINDSYANMTRVLEETRGTTDAVICGGLFVFDEFTLANFEQAGYPLPKAYGENVYSLAKAIPVDYKTVVRDIATSINYPAVVHSHTTCAVTDLTTRKYGFKKPDRFPHWYQHNSPLFSECAHCPTEQKTECIAQHDKPVETVIEKANEALVHIGYPHLNVVASTNVPKLLLVQGGALSYEELAYLRERSGWYVDNLPDHEGFLWRAQPAVERDLVFDGKKYTYEELIATEFLVGQEWHVVLKQNNQKLNATVLRWLRSRVRNRIQGILQSEITSQGIKSTAQKLSMKSAGTQTEEYFADLLESIQ